MQPHSLFCVLRKLLLASLHTRLACIFTLLMRRVNAASQPRLWLEAYSAVCTCKSHLSRVNAASQPRLWLEGLLLISQHI